MRSTTWPFPILLQQSISIFCFAHLTYAIWRKAVGGFISHYAVYMNLDTYIALTPLVCNVNYNDNIYVYDII